MCAKRQISTGENESWRVALFNGGISFSQELIDFEKFKVKVERFFRKIAPFSKILSAGRG
jgi:hypothetical protein